MAITGTDANIASTQHDSLMTTTVDKSIIGGTMTGNGIEAKAFFGGDILTIETALAGVTPQMAQNIGTGIENYRTEVEAILSKLQAVDSTSAFRGGQIGTALSNFIEGVKEVSFAYLKSLEAAEREIVDSVARSYEAQDQDLSGQLGSDTNNLSGAAPGSIR